MCIVCNLAGNEQAAFDYMEAYAKAQAAMKEATDAMLKCARLAVDGQIQKNYDAEHKAMVKVCRQWNMFEHTREKHS